MIDRCLAALAGLFLAVLAVCPARADDWPQFRRDAQRTGASRDRLAVPLTEIWSRTSPRGVRGEKPAMSTVAAWRGRLYFTTRELLSAGKIVNRNLVCVDERTGVILWRQPLSSEATGHTGGIRDEVGPAVTRSGMVIAYDVVPVDIPLGPALGNAATTAQRVRRIVYGCLRAYRARDGAPLATRLWCEPRDATRIQDAHPGKPPPVPRLILLDPHYGPNQVIVDPDDGQPAASDYVPLPGHPLVVGDEVIALAESATYMRLNPVSGAPSLLNIFHPIPGLPDPSLFAANTQFRSFPMALAAGGVVLGDNTLSRFVGILSGLGEPGWHRDMPCNFGIPAVDAGSIFLGAGGPSAQRGIIAMDAGSGAVRWAYPDTNLYDPVDLQVVPLPSVIGTQRFPTFPAGAPVPNQGSGLRPPAAGGPAGVPLRPGTVTVPGRGAPGGIGGRAMPGSMPGRTGPASPPGVRGGGASVPPPGTAFTFGSGAMTTQQAQLQALLAAQGSVTLGGGGAAIGIHNPLPAGHWSNAGIVAEGGKVYAVAANSLVCLDQQTGRPIWRVPTPLANQMRSLVGTRDYLLASAPDSVVTFKKENGQLVARLPMPGSGSLALANGLAFLTHGSETLHALAPAERTYRLAIDRPYADSYRRDSTPKAEDGDPVPCGAAGGTEAAGRFDCSPASQPPPQPGPGVREGPPPLADATVLRLRWEHEVATLVAKAKERREAVPGVPLLLSLDWLNAARSVPSAPPTLAGRAAMQSAAYQDAFAQACGALAAAVLPERFDIGPEVNVYLARNPTARDAVLALLKSAAAAIRKASPKTRIVVSFNVEVLANRYRGPYLPFGKITLPLRMDLAPLAPLVDVADELGITTYPQSATVTPDEVMGNHLLWVRDAVGDKPVLVTKSAVRVDHQPLKPDDSQFRYCRRILQLCYWLDATFVVYPDTVVDPPNDRLTAVMARPEMPALGTWQDVLLFQPVKRLTATAALPDILPLFDAVPGAPEGTRFWVHPDLIGDPRLREELTELRDTAVRADSLAGEGKIEEGRQELEQGLQRAVALAQRGGYPWGDSLLRQWKNALEQFSDRYAPDSGP